MSAIDVAYVLERRRSTTVGPECAVGCAELNLSFGKECFFWMGKLTWKADLESGVRERLEMWVLA